MEAHLLEQINELIMTIVGLNEVVQYCTIPEFRPIDNREQALWAAKKLRLHRVTDEDDAEAICQKIVDFNNETKYMFRKQASEKILADRKRIAKTLGKNIGKNAGMVLSKVVG